MTMARRLSGKSPPKFLFKSRPSSPNVLADHRTLKPSAQKCLILRIRSNHMLMGYDEYQRKAAEEFRRVDGLYLEDNITRMALIYNLHARGKHYATI